MKTFSGGLAHRFGFVVWSDDLLTLELGTCILLNEIVAIIVVPVVDALLTMNPIKHFAKKPWKYNKVYISKLGALINHLDLSFT